MKVFYIIILLFLNLLSNHLIAQGLYCQTKKETNLILPDFETNVEIKKGECFMILNSYREFFLVNHLSTNRRSRKGYLLKSDVKTFIEYDIKRGGSLQSFIPVADTIYYEVWNDSTIQKWNRIARERHGQPPYVPLFLEDSILILKDSI